MDKVANFIVVGGPIAVGKSTLVNNLGFPKIDELDADDKLQSVLLEQTYAHNRVADEVIEMFFLERRKERYQQFSNTLITHVFDRSILETYHFAREKLAPRSFQHFEVLFNSEVEDLFNQYGKPKLYILLTYSWDVFYERIMTRARDQEIRNFNANIDFFKRHVETYEQEMLAVMKKYNINYRVINTTNLDSEDVLNMAKQFLQEVLHD